MESIDEKKLYEMQFVQLIFSLKTSAMMQLGKIANPLTGNIERNLNEAKYTIDMLNMIKEKTKGNLTDDEQKIIDDAVFELQMNYLDEVKKGEEEKKETKPEGKEEITEKETKEQTEKPSEKTEEGQEPEVEEKEEAESKEYVEKEEEKEEKPVKEVKEKLGEKKSKNKKEK